MANNHQRNTQKPALVAPGLRQEGVWKRDPLAGGFWHKVSGNVTHLQVGSDQEEPPEETDQEEPPEET
jgi:hypothetical protein